MNVPPNFSPNSAAPPPAPARAPVEPLIAAYQQDIPLAKRPLIGCSNPRCAAGQTKQHRGPCQPAIRCARPQCESVKPVSGIRPERIQAVMEAEGYCFDPDIHNGRGAWFCGKTCRDIERKRLTLPNAVAKPKPLPAITRVSVADLPGDGRIVRWVVCDLWECPTKISAPMDVSGDKAAMLATASGFIQYEYGTFCSHQCASLARGAILGGRQDPIDDPDTKADEEHARAESSQAQAPVPVIAPPAPPPAVAKPAPPFERMSLHAESAKPSAPRGPQPQPPRGGQPQPQPSRGRR